MALFLLKHLCLHGKVARDQDLKEQIGKDIYFDLVDHDKVRSFRIQKQTPFQQFKVSAGEFFIFIFHFYFSKRKETTLLKKWFM